MPNVAPYGFWDSPITADRVVESAVRLASAKVSGGAVFWIEGRPAEKGRSVLVREGQDLTPPPYNVRTRVHEYGGGAYTLDGETACFSHDSDQRLYRLEPDGEPRPLTPERAWRFADGVVSGGRWIGVREDHEGPGEPVNQIVAVPTSGGEPTVLVSGAEFYAAPRVSPDGSQLCWIEWRHPDMPWDTTQLKLVTLDTDGIADVRVIAGGAEESVISPRFAPDGTLYFLSDRNGWWNLYRLRGDEVESVVARQADFGYPPWVFDWSTYAFESATRAWCTFHTVEGWRLGVIALEAGTLEEIDCPYRDIWSIEAEPGRVVFLGGSPEEPTAVVEMDAATRSFRVHKRSAVVDEALRPHVSIPRAIEFPTTEGRTAYAFYYPPKNPDFAAPEVEKPPLIVVSHGGPTAQTTPTLSLKTQFWTSRGFGVVDVNYGGSTGYGREYRERLAGRWGEVDVDDCVAAALFLAEQGEVDRGSLLIRGSSAGGYTTLAALTFRDIFSGGASYYGVSDLSALAEDTHKFESRYLDKLIGPYPERKELYDARSPIVHADGLSAPVIFLQGAEDKVVPPDQAERMVEVLRRKGVPTSYILFDGEQHGFRQAENIKRALEAELEFYREHVLGAVG